MIAVFQEMHPMAGESLYPAISALLPSVSRVPWRIRVFSAVIGSQDTRKACSRRRAFLLNIDEESLAKSPSLGAVWEIFLFAEMRKLNSTLTAPVNMWYYRDQMAGASQP